MGTTPCVHQGYEDVHRQYFDRLELKIQCPVHLPKACHRARSQGVQVKGLVTLDRHWDNSEIAGEYMLSTKYEIIVLRSIFGASTPFTHPRLSLASLFQDPGKPTNLEDNQHQDPFLESPNSDFPFQVTSPVFLKSPTLL